MDDESEGVSDEMTIAGCQIALDDLGTEDNTEKIRKHVESLPEKVDVAVFPEHSLTGFVGDGRIRDKAMRTDEAVSRLSDVAERNDTDVVAGFVEKEEGGNEGEEASYYNTTAYLRSGGEPKFYRKRHLWGKERELLEEGDGRLVTSSPVGRAGFLTCYDLNFVEESVGMKREGVDVLFVTGAWLSEHVGNWELLLRARALDGVRWLVGVGRTGTGIGADGSSVEYAGSSMVVSPDGSVHTRIGRKERDIVATIDAGTVEAHRDAIGVR